MYNAVENDPTAQLKTELIFPEPYLKMYFYFAGPSFVS